MKLRRYAFAVPAFSLALAVLWGTGSVRRLYGAEATLVSTEAVFETTDNDKSHKSFVTISVKCVWKFCSRFIGQYRRSLERSQQPYGSPRPWQWMDEKALSGRTKSELSFSTNGNDKMAVRLRTEAGLVRWDQRGKPVQRSRTHTGRSLPELCTLALKVPRKRTGLTSGLFLPTISSHPGRAAGKVARGFSRPR